MGNAECGRGRDQVATVSGRERGGDRREIDGERSGRSHSTGHERGSDDVPAGVVER